MTDYRDLVIADLADAEVAAKARIGELEHENSVLRDMVYEALAQLTTDAAHLRAARATIVALRKAADRIVPHTARPAA